MTFDLSTAESKRTIRDDKADRVISVTARTNQTGKEKAGLSLDLTAGELTGEGVLGYQFDLLYDKEIIEPQAILCGVSDTLSSKMTAFCYAAEPGILKVAVFGTTPISDEGTLLRLNFKVAGARGASLPSSIRNFMFNEDQSTVVSVSGHGKK